MRGGPLAMTATRMLQWLSVALQEGGIIGGRRAWFLRDVSSLEFARIERDRANNIFSISNVNGPHDCSLRAGLRRI